MHTVIVRKDLNMRRGKMAAQSAHALMKTFINTFSAPHGSTTLFLDTEREKQILGWQQNPTVSVRLVDDLNELSETETAHESPVFCIEDIGRTEFHGIKTVTCTCLVDPDWRLSENPFVPQISSEPLRAKQVIVVRRDIKLTKEDLCEYAAIASVDAMLNAMASQGALNDVDLDTNTPLSIWLRSAFGKIVVGIPDLVALDAIAHSAFKDDCTVGQAFGPDGEPVAIALGPDFPECIDRITGSLKLL